MFETSWQDIVLTIGNLLFLFALFPSIFSKDKPSKWTSLLYAAVLAVFTFVYSTLNLFFAAVVVFLTVLAWLVLFFQKITQK